MRGARVHVRHPHPGPQERKMSGRPGVEAVCRSITSTPRLLAKATSQSCRTWTPSCGLRRQANHDQLPTVPRRGNAAASPTPPCSHRTRRTRLLRTSRRSRRCVLLRASCLCLGRNYRCSSRLRLLFTTAAFRPDGVGKRLTRRLSSCILRCRFAASSSAAGLPRALISAKSAIRNQLVVLLSVQEKAVNAPS